MNKDSANELKTKGVSILENETVITVRGADRFVVLDIETYNYLRECELDKAIRDSGKVIEKGRFVAETPQQHIERLTNDL